MSPMSIIVADDVQEIQDLVAHWLTVRGHTVACASTGEEALKLVRKKRFDLIITDVLMPDGDGLDMISHLKERGESVPILAISGGGKYMAATDCIKLARGMGAHAALLKPFDERQLLDGIDRALVAKSSEAASNPEGTSQP